VAAEPERTVVIEDPALAAGFTLIPNVVLSTDLSPVAKLIYGVLLSAEGGRTTDELVERLRLSRKTVYRHARELEEAGWARSRHGHGTDRTKTYFAVHP
jgi:predicted transcriptional regulator